LRRTKLPHTRESEFETTCCDGALALRMSAAGRMLRAPAVTAHAACGRSSEPCSAAFECGWAGSSRGRKHSATGALEVGTLRQRYGETEHARRPRPRQTCTSDRMHRRNLRCPLQSKGNERPGHLKRPTTTAIWPCIEISRPKRRSGAAYLLRHRRSRTGGHAIITDGRHTG